MMQQIQEEEEDDDDSNEMDNEFLFLVSFLFLSWHLIFHHREQQVLNVDSDLSQKFFESSRYMGVPMSLPPPTLEHSPMPMFVVPKTQLPPISCISANKESPLSPISCASGYCSSPEQQEFVCGHMSLPSCHAVMQQSIHNCDYYPPMFSPKQEQQLPAFSNPSTIWSYAIKEFVIDSYSYSCQDHNSRSLHFFQGGQEEANSSSSSSSSGMHGENCSSINFLIDTQNKDCSIIFSRPVHSRSSSSSSNGIQRFHHKRIAFDYHDIEKIYFHVSEKEGVLLLKQCRPPRSYVCEESSLPSNEALSWNWEQVHPDKNFMHCCIHELHCQSSSLVKLINNFRNLHDRFKSVFVNNVNELKPTTFYQVSSWRRFSSCKQIRKGGRLNHDWTRVVFGDEILEITGYVKLCIKLREKNKLQSKFKHRNQFTAEFFGLKTKKFQHTKFYNNAAIVIQWHLILHDIDIFFLLQVFVEILNEFMISQRQDPSCSDGPRKASWSKSSEYSFDKFILLFPKLSELFHSFPKIFKIVS